MPECSCEELRERIDALEARLAQAPVRGKRAPSQYNIFIGRCVKQIEKEGPITERFRRCSARYKQGER